MKWGLLVRASDRGLGNLSREVHRHLAPTRTLVVLPPHQKLVQHLEWFDGADRAHLTDRGLFDNEAAVKKWLAGLDVVLHCETAYDWRICDWAREFNCRSVVWGMPEYVRHGRADCTLPAPDQWWNPTGWRMDRMPEGTRRVPVPVPIDRWPDPDLHVDAPPRWLHVAGARAALDRNGTRIILAALRLLRQEHHVTIRAQDEAIYDGSAGRRVHVERHQTGLEDYWRLYDNADALLLPRRYGGLSLVALEGMGAGLALVMPDVEPQRSEWPILPIAAPYLNVIETPAGAIPLCAPDPKDLARLMDACAAQPDMLAVARREARGWAEKHSWEVLGPTILAELERV